MSKLLSLDIEVLPNYFLVGLKDIVSGEVKQFEMFGVSTKLETSVKKELHKIMLTSSTFGFNSNNYDLPLIVYALEGATCKDIHSASSDIINKAQPYWMTYRNLGIEPRPYDHFDICEPSPAVMISLKNYGSRIGSKRLQDFYLDPNTNISGNATQLLKKYNINDLDTTIDLYNSIKGRIDLRVSLGNQYNMDLRSKSDAQIAETVIVSELEKSGAKVSKPTLPRDYQARYTPPTYITFKTENLNELLRMVKSIKFELDSNGSVMLPKRLADKKIVIGQTVYNMGIGGLHSQEKSLSIKSNDKYVLRNADFTSYYPFIIINNRLYPKHLGRKFLDIYKGIVDRRLRAKIAGDKLTADSLKITINGSFGKFGSKYSKLYSPDLLLATTITGQLTLLMLIEAFELNGIRVVSANTDGLEYYCPRDKIKLAEALIFDLELDTGFQMEHGEYIALHAKDVNNYVAVYSDHVKSKGLYAETTLSKGRSTPIVYTAIRKYLFDGYPLRKTIKECSDMNEFVSARTVKGGGQYDGDILGKVVRWYYSTKSKGCITYTSNGNKVPKTDGCKPMMELLNHIPNDLDYDWYVNEAISKLKDLGVDYAE